MSLHYTVIDKIGTAILIDSENQIMNAEVLISVQIITYETRKNLSNHENKYLVELQNMIPSP